MDRRPVIIAVGDNCIDLYRNTGEAFPGGNAVNVAVHARAAGADSRFLGCFGSDIMAELLIRSLREKDVDISRCPVAKGTTKACCYALEDGERRFLNVEAGESWAGPPRVTEEDLPWLSGADVLVSSCNAKIPERMAELAALPPCFAFDFGEKDKYRTGEYYDQVCASGMDLAMFSMAPMDEESFRRFAEPLHRRGVIHVLATLGGDGQMLSAMGTILRFRPERLKALDTTGAGDSFLGGFVTALAGMGWRKGQVMEAALLQEALHRGAAEAAASVMQPGGIGIKASLTQDEIQRWEKQLHEYR